MKTDEMKKWVSVLSIVGLFIAPLYPLILNGIDRLSRLEQIVSSNDAEYRKLNRELDYLGKRVGLVEKRHTAASMDLSRRVGILETRYTSQRIDSDGFYGADVGQRETPIDTLGIRGQLAD